VKRSRRPALGKWLAVTARRSAADRGGDLLTTVATGMTVLGASPPSTGFTV
jgi:hypothetical protein